MKMNIKNITLVALFALLIIPLSCKKGFLNTTDTAAATADNAFGKSSSVVSLVNSIYNTFQSSDMLKKSIWYYANYETHDYFNNGGDIVWNYYGIQSDFYALPTFWNNSYIGIIRANNALPIIQNAMAKGVVTQALGTRLQGEVYFLRGLMYYYLAGSFGGVPLELKPTSDGLTPRSTQAQVFAQVVADMKQAENMLVSKTVLPSTDLGRATKGAAYGYEGAAQMWLGKYADALTAFNNTELTSNYHLLSDYMKVGEYSNQNNDESLFEVQFLVTGNQSWGDGWQDGGEEGWIDDFDWPQEISGFGYDYANPGLWYSFQAGDRRKAFSILGPGDQNLSKDIIDKWGGIKGYAVVQANYQSNPTTYSDGAGNPINTCGTLTHPWYGTDGTPRSGYYDAKKWRDPTLTGANGTGAIFGGQNQTLLRYAEVLLDRAECKIRTGDVAGGLADIKLVRDRAWGGTAPAVMQDGLTWDGKPTQPITDPLQMVYSEYRHELSAEYSVFYDLRRAGPGVAAAFIQNAYGTQAGNTNQIVYPYGPTKDGKTHGVWNTSLPANKDILPIPESAIGLNPNLTQNPGY
ncbi:RagB/SusD family nutrient uptake outer membrane protein [Mucilaginibacter sp.]|uniref:RagB/SusD family nutrient uptake outer membrane protein n=1 Tax=Mucilaginibacter sp. TaxID=1882438 RepID=UPI00284372AE|nr:RagB/SusD family nutrient uptake outer membrane protein [Mucilaginibacter sp.]MDR3697169.1 RagB/SusD family nutrient uptake outer membrane protein [Mucilaginibacter sp.]